MQTKKYGLIGPLLGLDWYIGDNRGTNVLLTSPANPGVITSYSIHYTKLYDEKIVLSKIAEEVANHEGNVWAPIISLKRGDAVRTGFDKVESWHSMLSYYAPTIAESMKIPSYNFV